MEPIQELKIIYASKNNIDGELWSCSVFARKKMHEHVHHHYICHKKGMAYKENMAVDHQCIGALLQLVVTGPQWPWLLVSVWIGVLFENKLRALHMYKLKILKCSA